MRSRIAPSGSPISAASSHGAHQAALRNGAEASISRLACCAISSCCTRRTSTLRGCVAFSDTLPSGLAVADGSQPACGGTLTDSLPAGMLVDSAPALSNTCGGTATAVAGSGSVSLAAGKLPANGSCTVTLQVQAVKRGTWTNAVTVNAAGLGDGNTGEAVLVVSVSTPIPALHDWALVLLGLLLAGFAARVLRREDHRA